MHLLKRGLDVLLSGAGLVLSMPIWLAAAAAIKLEDGGPVFFRQERVGRNGRVFHVLKFRSMIPDAEAKFGARPRWTNCRRCSASSAAT
jgi:lipopolysaccharide/colanic/teichoic acid biosynthesis glycosyltransferase